MNIARLAAAFAVVAGVALAAGGPASAATTDDANVVGQPFSIASAPAQIDSCAAIRDDHHLNFAVTFRDTQPHTLVAVEISNVLIDPFDTQLATITETLTGTYSPNVSIEDTGLNQFGQRMQIYRIHDDYPTARTDVCYVSAVRFDDGTVWRPTAADLPVKT